MRRSTPVRPATMPEGIAPERRARTAGTARRPSPGHRSPSCRRWPAVGRPVWPSVARVITARVMVPMAPTVSACKAVNGGSHGATVCTPSKQKPTASQAYPRCSTQSSGSRSVARPRQRASRSPCANPAARHISAVASGIGHEQPCRERNCRRAQHAGVEPVGRHRRRDIGPLPGQPVAGEAGNDAAADQADQQQQDGDAEPVAELRGVGKPQRRGVDQGVRQQQTGQRPHHRQVAPIASGEDLARHHGQEGRGKQQVEHRRRDRAECPPTAARRCVRRPRATPAPPTASLAAACGQSSWEWRSAGIRPRSRRRSRRSSHARARPPAAARSAAPRSRHTAPATAECRCRPTPRRAGRTAGTRRKTAGPPNSPGNAGCRPWRNRPALSRPGQAAADWRWRSCVVHRTGSGGHDHAGIRIEPDPATAPAKTKGDAEPACVFIHAALGALHDHSALDTAHECLRRQAEHGCHHACIDSHCRIGNRACWAPSLTGLVMPLSCRPWSPVAVFFSGGTAMPCIVPHSPHG